MSTDPVEQPATELVESPDKVLRVRGGTDTHKLASAIAGVVERSKQSCVVEFIGAGAGNQAIKAVAIANSILAGQGKFISIVPSFVKRNMKDNSIATALQLRVITHTLNLR